MAHLRPKTFLVFFFGAVLPWLLAQSTPRLTRSGGATVADRASALCGAELEESDSSPSFVGQLESGQWHLRWTSQGLQRFWILFQQAWSAYLEEQHLDSSSPLPDGLQDRWNEFQSAALLVSTSSLEAQFQGFLRDLGRDGQRQQSLVLRQFLFEAREFVYSHAQTARTRVERSLGPRSPEKMRFFSVFHEFARQHELPEDLLQQIADTSAPHLSGEIALVRFLQSRSIPMSDILTDVLVSMRVRGLGLDGPVYIFKELKTGEIQPDSDIHSFKLLSGRYQLLLIWSRETENAQGGDEAHRLARLPIPRGHRSVDLVLRDGPEARELEQRRRDHEGAQELLGQPDQRSDLEILAEWQSWVSEISGVAPNELTIERNQHEEGGRFLSLIVPVPEAESVDDNLVANRILIPLDRMNPSHFFDYERVPRTLDSSNKRAVELDSLQEVALIERVLQYHEAHAVTSDQRRLASICKNLQSRLVRLRFGLDYKSNHEFALRVRDLNPARNDGPFFVGLGELRLFLFVTPWIAIHPQVQAALLEVLPHEWIVNSLIHQIQSEIRTVYDRYDGVYAGRYSVFIDGWVSLPESLKTEVLSRLNRDTQAIFNMLVEYQFSEAHSVSTRDSS